LVFFRNKPGPDGRDDGLISDEQQREEREEKRAVAKAVRMRRDPVNLL